MKKIVNNIKKFFGLTRKEVAICTIIVILTTLGGVTERFIGLFAFNVMAMCVYQLIKCPYRRRKEVKVMIFACGLIAVVAGALIYSAAGITTLCGSCAGLCGTLFLKEAAA